MVEELKAFYDGYLAGRKSVKRIIWFAYVWGMLIGLVVGWIWFG